ncbi:MAG: oxygen-independent coproporphyrinogen III oxidase [Leptothrix ochracea]|uniref:oxygen-independent coproporphyrinogen III oxidase n=1 Tax=Leptothrix ochracea TaxID=735331 RepID=UPI0034E25864
MNADAILGTPADVLPVGIDEPIVFGEDLLHKMDIPGPRYTSYPTADRFVEAVTDEFHALALKQRRVSAGTAVLPLSIYIHIPFCESVCYYCACNKIVTKDRSKSDAYLKALESEVSLISSHLGVREVVSQLHFGGGTPTFLTDAEISKVFEMLKMHFDLAPDGEYSIEIDPRTVNEERLTNLKSIGFNRISFGVQDFDQKVQVAVHRVQPFEQVADLMKIARRLGYSSINVDLIYGLPLQTPESFSKTVELVSSIRPDRIAMYGYAHLPSRFKPQRRINNDDLPSGTDRLGMLSTALSGFVSKGYRYIGMDHFALPDDPLAVAKRQGLLHRNFQGYSTQPDCDLIGLGVSAISKFGATYTQNAKTLDEYYDYISRNTLPTIRGFNLSRDDVLRRSVIMAIMCHGRLNFESVQISHLIEFKSYFKNELIELGKLSQDGLLTIQADGFQLTDLGWYFVRYVAMVFDKYLQIDRGRGNFSKVI